MSKTNDISKLRIEDVEAFSLDLGGANTFTVRELRDDELDNVSGGSIIKPTGHTKWGDIVLKGG